jgi:nitrile hydratase
MDGPHDLGGRQGFGPVDVGEPEEPFHAPWEGRMWGIARGMRRLAGWNIDWFRHCRELIDPADYLTRPYFDQWMQDYAAMVVDSDAATVEEIAAGSARSPGSQRDAAPGPETVEALRGEAINYERPTAAPPAFSPGDRVRCKAHGQCGHTRLPGYARGRAGMIHAHHGAHVFPDANARGEERAEALYSVVFDAAELWPEAAGRRERVYLDLWESYLERV